MTIIEIRGRGGQLLERFRSDAPTIAVGRAFDNDLILEDEHVSPHHLRLTCTDAGWQFEDLDSLNGIRHRSRAAEQGVLRSGDELRVGHTSLHVYDEHHVVEPALRLTGAEARLAELGRHGIWSTLVAGSLAVSAVRLFWGSVADFEPLTTLQPLMVGILGTCLIAAGWALVGRLLRHRASYFAHLSLWLIFALLGVLTTFVAHTVGYNASSQRLEVLLEEALFFAVLGFTAWGSLTLATNLREAGRLYAALGVAAVALAVDLAGELRFQPVFSSRPDYYARLQGAALLWARPVAERQLLDELPALFDLADATVEEDQTTPPPPEDPTGQAVAGS